MSDKRFVCIDVGYGDDWYITDNGERLSEMEIVGLLNELYEENNKLKEINKDKEQDVLHLYKQNEQLSKEHQEMLEKYVLLRLKIGEVLNDE